MTQQSQSVYKLSSQLFKQPSCGHKIFPGKQHLVWIYFSWNMTWANSFPFHSINYREFFILLRSLKIQFFHLDFSETTVLFDYLSTKHGKLCVWYVMFVFSLPSNVHVCGMKYFFPIFFHLENLFSFPVCSRNDIFFSQTMGIC